jgi:SAM-dependent methyltransferase
VIEVRADFSGQGRHYTHFPDRKGFRISLDDLRREEVRTRLKAIWTDPHSLDPAKVSAKTTRDIAERLAKVSRALEGRGHDPKIVAAFLMRCLFAMFAEDVGLLPEDSFRKLLSECEVDPSIFVPSVSQLFEAMDRGAFAHALKKTVKRFNGKLYKERGALALLPDEIKELSVAASKNWREVEPAIFGTLLEQALSAQERAQLGAHYTPRAYVERLVNATVMDPLRADWDNVRATVERLKSAGDENAAREEVERFWRTLCETRVLDPACGTGNFLYVALELMKRLEGEVLETLTALGGQEMLTGFARGGVDPHQFLGLELNPRAAEIAELVLWIGYLQWFFRTRTGEPAEPIITAFGNINNGSDQPFDAVLKAERRVKKENGRLVLGPDGHETYEYLNPTRPEWPEAEFIVGNPPFLGKGAAMRGPLGDAYVDALWAAHPHMNESADFVMFWWDRAAEVLTTKGTKLRRFGFVTTNSITQVFNRRVVERHMAAKSRLSLVFAVPDHPWTKATKDAAAVRIAMTVAEAGQQEGLLLDVVGETGIDTDSPIISTNALQGPINADLTVGADVTKSKILRANDGIACNGMMLAGRWFVLNSSAARDFEQRDGANAKAVVKPFLNGGDLLRGFEREESWVVDLFGQTEHEVSQRTPAIYEFLLQHLKPERNTNRRAAFRERWWVFGEPRRTFRPALSALSRYIGTTETSKHRIFQFLDTAIVPDHMIIAIALDDAFHLGVLSSRAHVVWALRAGGWLGVGNDPRYSKSRVFDPFPFPDPGFAARAEIAAIAEEIDAHRKRQQALHPKLTMTQMYNVLAKLRGPVAGAGADGRAARGHEGSGEQGTLPLPDAVMRHPQLTPQEVQIKEDGLLVTLAALHDRLDAAVAAAYGWPAALSDEEIVARLVALNAERAAEEAKGQVRWLRPDYQMARAGLTPRKKDKPAQTELALLAPAARKPSFPAGDFEQTAAVVAALAMASAPLSADAVAGEFRQGRKVSPKIDATLKALARLGRVESAPEGYRLLRR